MTNFGIWSSSAKMPVLLNCPSPCVNPVNKPVELLHCSAHNFMSLGESQRTQREPKQTWGKHTNPKVLGWMDSNPGPSANYHAMAEFSKKVALML